jgi:hypothetical protein
MRRIVPSARARSMRKRKNSKSAKAVTTRYAALMVLVDIANRQRDMGKRRSDILMMPESPAREAQRIGLNQRQESALVRALGCAQELAGTPNDLRVGKSTPDEGYVVIARPPPLEPYRIQIGGLYADALGMRNALAGIAVLIAARMGLPVWQIEPYPMLATRRRPLNITPTYSIDPGPELFGDTLLRALAGRDVRRIRQCPECSRLFVAVPADKTACRRKCASAQRVKKFLADPKNAGYYARSERERRKEQREGETPAQRKEAARRARRRFQAVTAQ